MIGVRQRRLRVASKLRVEESAQVGDDGGEPQRGALFRWNGMILDEEGSKRCVAVDNTATLQCGHIRETTI